jgi:uncharacterized SAM-binding protein YcdF (DUF218 family)
MKKKLGIIIFIVLAFFLILFFSHEYLLRKAGRFLVLDQSPRKADAIVILNGRPTERCLAAVDLYNKDFAKLIVLASLQKQPGTDEFRKRVGRDFKGKTFTHRALEAMGIPENDLKFIGDGVAGTYDEAKATRKFLKENGYQSILLVTSKWHSRRTFLTFKSVFKNENGICITSCPSIYDTFDPDAWWKNESDAELVFGEYVKLVYYILTFRISLFD